MSEFRESPPSRKRSQSDDEGEPRPKRRYAAGGHVYEVRFLVQSQEAGTIIGRNGDNIKRLRQDFQATSIQVSDNRGPERIASFTAESEVLTDVLEDILKLFEDKRQSERRRDEDHREDSYREDSELRMLIHQSQAGCVIGKAGGKLRDMRQDFGVEVKVYASCCPMSTDRIVRVTGAAKKVVKCLIYIIEMLRTWPPKGFNSPYDPLNYDPDVVREYGGYIDESGRFGGGGGRYGGRDRGPRVFMEERGGMPARGGAPAGYPVGPPRHSAAGPVTTQQVSIPADLAGLVIGKAGQRIKQVRLDSGADVELSDNVGGTNDRIITITGTLQQIQAAQYMMQMAVKQSLERQ